MVFKEIVKASKIASQNPIMKAQARYYGLIMAASASLPLGLDLLISSKNSTSLDLLCGSFLVWGIADIISGQHHYIPTRILYGIEKLINIL